jgi:hypothetical protein
MPNVPCRSAKYLIMLRYIYVCLSTELSLLSLRISKFESNHCSEGRSVTLMVYVRDYCEVAVNKYHWNWALFSCKFLIRSACWHWKSRFLSTKNVNIAFVVVLYINIAFLNVVSSCRIEHGLKHPLAVVDWPVSIKKVISSTRILQSRLLICFNYGFDTDGVWEQGAEEHIWTKEGWCDGRLEETA